MTKRIENIEIEKLADRTLNMLYQGCLGRKYAIDLIGGGV